MVRRRAATLLSSLAILALTASACGSPSGVSFTGPGGDDQVDGPPASSCHVDDPDCDDGMYDGDGDHEMEAELVEPREGVADMRPRAWENVEISPDDPRTVTVYFWSGVEPCYVLGDVQVEETDDTVTITLFEGHEEGSGDVACIEIALYKKVVVELSEDIGARSLLDGFADS
jgi:hypothetical protein